MTSSPSERHAARASSVAVDGSSLRVELIDGRTVTVPLAWYPRLAHGSDSERSRWELIGQGLGVHWPDLDEDIAVEDLLAGRPSGESQASLGRWLAGRKQAG